MFSEAKKAKEFNNKSKSQKSHLCVNVRDRRFLGRLFFLLFVLNGFPFLE